MAAKRRKVWVNVHDGGDNGDYATAWLNSKAAKNNSGVRVRAVAVPMVERLPGDVVLSRGEAAARKHAAERLEVWLKGMKMESFDECDHIRQSCGDVGCTRPVTDAIALLRGRR